ncbi:MAG: hypothetical protein AAFN27_20175 [Pseudomonadota bacterium]
MSDEAVIVGGKTHRGTVSDEISRAVRDASAQIDKIDRDPLIRIALAKVTIRSFAQHMAATFPDDLEALAEEFERVAELVREGADLPDDFRRELAPDAEETAQTGVGGETDAEDREPVREARGGGQADPQRADTGSTRRKGARHNGPQRIGKEHTVLRVGGA